MNTREDALESLKGVVKRSRLIAEGSSGVVLISGGADSTCLAAAVAEFCGRPNVHALHLNYGLRESAGDDEQLCRRLCGLLRIDLRVERPVLGKGNLQAAARDARYSAAERLRERLGCDWVATGHTRTDFAETMLYRLASSPGTRALLGLPPRRDRVVRPLLAIGRADTRRLAAAAALPFGDDPTNLDPRFARNRIRAEVLPAMRDVNNEAERNIAETRAELAEEARLLDRVVAQALDAAGAGDAAIAIRADALEGTEPALRRLALRTLAERAAGHEVALGRRRAGEIWRLARLPEGGEVDLGGGVRALCEQGLIRFAAGDEALLEPVALTVPGRVRFGVGDPGRAATVAPRGKRPGAGDPRSRCGRQRRRRPRVARGRPHPTPRNGGIQDAPGPVHRSQGPAIAATHASGRDLGRPGGVGGGRGRLRGVPARPLAQPGGGHERQPS